MSNEIERHWPTRYQNVPTSYLEATASDDLRGLGPQLALIGPAGSGKTWQLWGLVIHHRELRPDSPPRIWLVSEALDIEGHRWDQEWLRAVAEFPGIVAIDDLGYRCQRPDSSPSEWAAHAAYVISDQRSSWRRRTIWTSNLTREQIAAAYGPPVMSRICSGGVVEVGGEDRRINKGDQ